MTKGLTTTEDKKSIEFVAVVDMKLRLLYEYPVVPLQVKPTELVSRTSMRKMGENSKDTASAPESHMQMQPGGKHASSAAFTVSNPRHRKFFNMPEEGGTLENKEGSAEGEVDENNPTTSRYDPKGGSPKKTTVGKPEDLDDELAFEVEFPNV